MKRKKLIIAAVSVVLLLGIVLTGIFFEKPPENTVCLFDDFFIYRSNNKKCEIYEKDVYVEDLGYKANKEIFSGWLYKYSYDANRGLIAVRQIDASETKNNTEPVISSIPTFFNSSFIFSGIKLGFSSILNVGKMILYYPIGIIRQETVLYSKQIKSWSTDTVLKHGFTDTAQ